MTLSRRLLNLARANLNALLDRTRSDASLDDLSDAELEAELERRRARKERELREREARTAAERAAAKKIDQDRRRARDIPRADPPPSNGRLRECYTLLEVPYGATFDEVKASFRRLMRKYHPDLHHGDAKKHKAATELSSTLTRAYEELERHLRAPT